MVAVLLLLCMVRERVRAIRLSSEVPAVSFSSNSETVKATHSARACGRNPFTIIFSQAPVSEIYIYAIIYSYIYIQVYTIFIVFYLVTNQSGISTSHW